jgi:diguanylate cyclase (GGDEF)-like protein
MISSQAVASFQFSVEACDPPYSDALPNWMEFDDASDWNPGFEKFQDDVSEGILMESGTHGNCYRLVRKSGAKSLPVVTPFPETRRSSRTPAGARTERRANIGNFQRVLVAEDHKGRRRMLVQMLNSWGFEAVPAANGSEALQIADQKRPPELIILSRMLPDIDVFELCQRLGNLQSDYAPYILVLAMQNDKHDIVRALEAGAAEYLTTPFEAMELRARLMVAVRILNRQETLVTSRDRFRLLATKDPLTGLWNRRSIQQILKDELERAGQSERTTGVLLIDLDHFKNVNDTYGHLAGDFVLQEASRRLKGSLRAYDSIGRYGGEEFLIVVPAAGEAELCELAERLRKAVADVPIRVGENEIRLTLSVGAAIAPSHVNLSSDVLGGADAALYDAKRRGRNRYVYSSLKLEQGAEVCTAGPSQLACPSVGRR